MSFLFASTASSQVYKLIELPMQYARGINDSGVVVGDAILWENGVSISTAPVYGYGINNKKQVTGSALVSADTIHAFLWEDYTATDLGTLGGLQAGGRAINESAEVAGLSYTPQGIHAFFWKNGVMTDIATGGEANGINDLGQVVGGYRIDDSTSHAFIWQNGTMSDLGALQGLDYSHARAINNAGQVVGTSLLSDTGGMVAVLWSGGGIVNLGRLLDSLWSVSDAFDINDAGEVVGSSTVGTAFNLVTAAFIWKNGVMTNLNSVTDTSGGWDLRWAVAINNQGDILCWGIYQGIPYVRSVLLKKDDLFLTHPKSEERLISGEEYTIRWKSGLPPGSNIVLELSLDSGKTWKYLAGPIPAESEKYVWTVPDTFSRKARVLISDASDFSTNDTSDIFKFKGYILTKLSPSGDYIAYKPGDDYWRFKNDERDIWRESWYTKFNYDSTDPFTGLSYQIGEPTTNRVFALAQRSDFPDWPSMVRAFGKSACYVDGREVYSPTAVAKWESRKRPFKGACFGLALSNALAFRYPTNFKNRYPILPDISVPFLVDPDSSILPVVHELFVHQYGEPHRGFMEVVDRLKTPTQTLKDLQAVLISDEALVRTLSLRNNGEGGGGHNVLAYKVISDDLIPGLFHVLYYENNDPNSTTAEILIDTTANNWIAPLDPTWGGTRGIFLRDPASAYLSQPTLPKIDSGYEASPFVLPSNIVEIDVPENSEVVIRDTVGNITGYVDSLVYGDIPNSYPLIEDNGRITPPYGYLLKLAPFEITLRKSFDPANRVFFFTGNKTFKADQSGADSNHTDKFYFDGGLTVANPDTAGKTFNFTNIINEFSHSQEKVFSIRSMTLLQGDSVRIANIGVDGLKLGSYNLHSTVYNLELELAAYTGTKHFAHDPVQLGGNSSHIIQPNWTTLNDSVLKILIDNGNDGTIDDSMLVSNQITGIHDSPRREIPTAFSLHQNYPNPFNPRTTVSYELPRASYVTLKIYDVFGREIATLVDGIQSAGVKSVEWNAANFASGIYICKLQAGEYVATRKLMLIK